MSDHSVKHSTFTLERSYAASPAAVFAAWSDRRHEGEVARGRGQPLLAEDFRVGGTEAVHGGDGVGLVARSEYHDIVPDERIVYTTDLFTDEVLSTVSLTTVRFARDGDGDRPGAHRTGHLPGRPGTARVRRAGHRLGSAGRPRPSGGPAMTADSERQIRECWRRAPGRLAAGTPPPRPRLRRRSRAVRRGRPVRPPRRGPRPRGRENWIASSPGSGTRSATSEDHRRSRSRVLPLPGPDQRTMRRAAPRRRQWMARDELPPPTGRRLGDRARARVGALRRRLLGQAVLRGEL